jgi:hypothetical protein
MNHPNMSDTLQACCGSLGYFLPYMRGEYPPNYPVPAILPKHTKLVHLGYVSAENGFSIEAVFNQYIRIT